MLTFCHVSRGLYSILDVRLQSQFSHNTLSQKRMLSPSHIKAPAASFTLAVKLIIQM